MPPSNSGGGMRHPPRRSLEQKNQEIVLFYDLLSSECQIANDILQKALARQLPSHLTCEAKGQTTWDDMIQIKMAPFPLPFNQFSFEISLMIPYLMNSRSGRPGPGYEDLLYNSSSTLATKYQQLCWDNLELIQQCAQELSRNQFLKKWSDIVYNHFKEDFEPQQSRDDILAIFQTKRELSNVCLERQPFSSSACFQDQIKQTWRFGAQIGINQVPNAVINHEKLPFFP